MKTYDSIMARRAAYQAAAEPLTTGMFLSRTAALTEADMAAAKTVVDNLPVVQALWNGDADTAVADLEGHIDFEDGDGRYRQTSRPGLGEPTPESTEVSFKASSGVVTDANAWSTYETQTLLEQLCGVAKSEPWVKKLNAQLEKLDPEFTQEQTELELASLDIKMGAYLGSGSAGPYGSGEFAADDGFEYIETTEGVLVRVGVGFGRMDGQLWELYDGDMFENFYATISQSPSEMAGRILLGSGASDDRAADLAQAAKELTLVVEYGMLLANSEALPSDEFMDAIFKADREYREEQGQQDLFKAQE